MDQERRHLPALRALGEERRHAETGVPTLPEPGVGQVAGGEGPVVGLAREQDHRLPGRRPRVEPVAAPVRRLETGRDGRQTPEEPGIVDVGVEGVRPEIPAGIVAR